MDEHRASIAVVMPGAFCDVITSDDRVAGSYQVRKKMRQGSGRGVVVECNPVSVIEHKVVCAGPRSIIS